MSEVEPVPESPAARILALAVPAAVGAALLAALFAASLSIVERADASPIAAQLLAPSVVGEPQRRQPPIAAASEALRPPTSPVPVVVDLAEAEAGLEGLQSRLEAARAGREFAFLPMQMTLARGSRTLAADIAASLAGQPGNWRLRVRVHAHTWGSPERNAAVARQRAEVLRERLFAAGMDDAHLSVEGVGDAEPVADLWTPRGRRQGRRIEILIEEKRHGPDRNLAAAG